MNHIDQAPPAERVVNANHPALVRERATRATLEKYRGKTFDWRTGTTCVHMFRFHLRQLGYRPPTMPRLRSALIAKREMQRRGWGGVEDLVDAMGLQRIAPAQMMLGDIATGPADEFFGAIGICAGPLKLLGWREDAADLVVLDTDFTQLTGAWRV